MDRLKIKRALVLFTAAIVLLALARTVYSFLRFNSVAAKFDSVQEGQSWDSVLVVLGKPNYHEGSCLQDLSGPRCKKELVYSHPFAPWIPEYYVIDFSADSRVTSKVNLISP